MKIMIQDRTAIIEQPKCVWVDEASDGSSSGTAVIASDSKRVPVLGTYSSPARAKEVLKEIFEYQRRGKCNFYMPLE